MLSGSYEHVVSVDLPHTHLPDDAGVLIYTDVMHQLLPLFLSLVGLRSFNMPLAACWGAASHSGQAGSWLRLTEPFRVQHLLSSFVQYLSEGDGVVMHYYNIHRNNCLFKPDILWVKEMERWIMTHLLSGEVLCISGRSNVTVFNRSAHSLQLGQLKIICNTILWFSRIIIS